MPRLTKKKQQELFLVEFLRRLREAPPGTRVYMRCGDLFKDADVFNLDDWRPGGPAPVVPNDDDGEGTDVCK